MTVKEETWKLTPRQREGRAINAVAELLRRALSVPNIYLEPPPSIIAADVLAVDRGGAGDLHAVEIILNDLQKGTLEDLQTTASEVRLEIVKGACGKLMTFPAHFRYLAIPAASLDTIRRDLLRFGIFAENGIGRLGIIAITEKRVDTPVAEIVLAPERFRVDPAKLKAIETKLLAKSRPDIEVRI